MYKKISKQKLNLIVNVIFIAIAAFLLLGSPFLVNAQEELGLRELEGQTQLVERPLPVLIGRIIQAFLGVLGIIAVGLIIYGGYIWMTAGGNEENIAKAKRILRDAVIGLIIILVSFAITQFIISRILGAGGGGVGPGPGAGGFPAPLPTPLGGSVLESHWPLRDAVDVPRNTMIAVTFKEAMDEESLIKDGKLNPLTVKIRKTADEEGPFVTEFAGTASEDNQTFVFRALNEEHFLGSSSENTPYTVILTTDIRTAQGRAAFGRRGDYQWNFTVGTTIDLKPPQVISVKPRSNSTVPRNSIIQIDFSEPVMPLMVIGAESKISVTAGGEAVRGRFSIGNDYQSVEFTTLEKCATNACGQDVYCLPEEKLIAALVKAATPLEAGPQASFPFDGVVDMASNALDGNKDGRTAGSPDDDYRWQFNTSSAIDITPPKITAISPSQGQTDTEINTNVEAEFSKPISIINSDKFYLDGFDGHYSVSRVNEESKGKAILRTYQPYLQSLATYYPVLTSEIKDSLQNCYSPCEGPGCAGADWESGQDYPSCVVE